MFNPFGNQGGTATIDHPVIGMNGQNRLSDCPPNVIPQHYGNVVAPNGAPINNIPGTFLGNVGVGYGNAVNPGYWNTIPSPTAGYGSVIPSNATPWQTINPGYYNPTVGMLPNTQPLGFTCPTPFVNNCAPTMQFGVPNVYQVNCGMPMIQPNTPAFAGFPNYNGMVKQTTIPTNILNNAPTNFPTHPWLNNVPVNTTTPFVPNYNGVCGPNVVNQTDLNGMCATGPMFATGLPNNFPMTGLNPWNTTTCGTWTNTGNLAYNNVPNFTGIGWNMTHPNGCCNDWNLPTWNMGYPNTAYNGTNGFNPFGFGHGGGINNPWNTINNPMNTLNHPTHSHWNGIGTLLPTFHGNHGFATHPINNYGSWNPCNTIGNFGVTGHSTGGIYNPAMMNPTHVGTWPIGTGSHGGFGTNAICNTPYGFNSVPVNSFPYGLTCCN